MSTLLQFANAGQNLTFDNDGSVSAVPVGAAAGAAHVKGVWNTDATGANSIQYELPNAAVVSVPVTYTVNTKNQLVVAITAQPAVTATLQGRILIEDNHRLAYYLVGDDGFDVQTELAFYVFGAIKIDPATNKLTVDLGNQNTLTITGTAGHENTALTAGVGDHLIDKITFQAITHNTLSTGADMPCGADISVLGAWDLKNGQIIFTADACLGGPAAGVDIVILGQLRGVAAGFELSTVGGNGPKLAFIIQGRIAGKDSSGNWNLSLGYSGKKMQATLQGNLVQKFGESTFSIQGQLTIAGGGGAPFSLTMDLRAEYVMKNGRFQIAVRGNTTTGYSLQLGGQLTVGNWAAKFDFSVGANGSPTLSISIGNASSGPLNSDLKFFLTKNGQTLTANLSISLKWVDGFLVT